MQRGESKEEKDEREQREREEDRKLLIGSTTVKPAMAVIKQNNNTDLVSKTRKADEKDDSMPEVLMNFNIKEMQKIP